MADVHTSWQAVQKKYLIILLAVAICYCNANTTVFPSSVNVAKGQSVNFTCAATDGHAYDWLLIVELDNGNQRISQGDYNTSTIIFSVIAENNATIKCNPFGLFVHSSNVALLYVQGLWKYYTLQWMHVAIYYS